VKEGEERKEGTGGRCRKAKEGREVEGRDYGKEGDGR
jgi:hypothetical protein